MDPDKIAQTENKQFLRGPRNDLAHAEYVKFWQWTVVLITFKPQSVNGAAGGALLYEDRSNCVHASNYAERNLHTSHAISYVLGRPQ